MLQNRLGKEKRLVVANVRKSFDVVIVGGGPAGIATGLTLGARGISYCIVEANLEPTRKLGEAIPPNARALFKKLGIQHLMEAAEHTAYYGNKSCWGSSELEQKEFIEGVYGHGYLLDRLQFEKQLRVHIRNNDGTFMAGYKLRKVLRTEKGIEAHIQNEFETQIISAKYIVDATGRKAAVCRQLGVQKQIVDNQFAIVCKAALFTSVAHQIMVEATKNGWWYAAPQSATELTLMFFTDLVLVPEKRKLASFLQNELSKTLHLSKLIATAVLDFETIKVMPAGTSKLKKPYGDCWIAVGDAAYAFDPISSYGITSALASGFYAGHAMASALANEEDAMLAYSYVFENAFQAYMEKLAGQYALEMRWEGSRYWKARHDTLILDLIDKPDYQLS